MTFGYCIIVCCGQDSFEVFQAYDIPLHEGMVLIIPRKGRHVACKIKQIVAMRLSESDPASNCVLAEECERPEWLRTITMGF